jgi:hypothetical protein
MSRKVFTAGEVLAAADVNSFLMDQSVMSFAGTAARGSAIPSPVDGMTTYLEDIDRLETYNGSIYTSPTDLILIRSQTIGSAVSSVVVSDVFNATYDAYKIIISGGVGSPGSNLRLSLGSSTSGHQQVLIYANYTGGGITAATSTNAANFGNIGHCDTNNLFAIIELANPFLSQITSITASYSDAGISGAMTGRHNTSTSFTAFTISPGTGTITGGTINVYGYRKAL